MELKIAKNNIHGQIVEYLKEVQHDFTPPLLERIQEKSRCNSFDEYVRKIISKGYVIYKEKQGEIAGIVFLYANDSKNKKAYIPVLSVKNKFSGKRIATELITKSSQLAESNGMTCISVQTWEANIPAIKLYQKLGFIKKTDESNVIIFEKKIG